MALAILLALVIVPLVLFFERPAALTVVLGIATAVVFIGAPWLVVSMTADPNPSISWWGWAIPVIFSLTGICAQTFETEGDDEQTILGVRIVLIFVTIWPWSGFIWNYIVQLI